MIRDNRIAKILGGAVLVLLLTAPPCRAQANNTTTYSTTWAEIDTVNTTNATQQVNTWQVELKARMQGGSYLYDQTFNVAYSDPTVQAAIAQAKTVLAQAGASSFSGPAQLSSTQSTSSATNTVETGRVAGTALVATNTYIGPQTIYITDRGICQSYTPSNLQLTGCSLTGQAFSIPAGGIDYDSVVVSPITINRTATTTNTTLTTQVYELDGIAAPAGTPAPPSLLLALGGLGAAGLYAARRRLWNRC